MTNVVFYLIYFYIRNMFCNFASNINQTFIKSKLMKKILLSLFTVLMSVAAFAQTEYKFNDASAWGNYENAAPGEFAQVNSGDVLTQGNLKISVSFTDGNGVRFFTATGANEGKINFRAYNGATVTLSTVDGSNMSAVEIAGSNLGSQYVKDFDGYNNGVWKGNANSITLTIIKSTVQINTITIYAGEAGPKDITNTPETAYTTSQAFDLIKAGEGLSSDVYVKGTVSSVKDIDTGDYGNATYFITDGTKELEIYRGYGLGGQKFTSTDDLQDGDEVIVYGKLVDYNGTYEMTTGSKIYSLNGKTQADNPGTGDNPGGGDDPQPSYTVVGKGTLEEPYTTEDIIKGIYKENAPVMVWVKGTILGCFGSAKEPISTKDAVASNIAIGNADGTNVIPVQLVYVKDGDNHVREALNLMDNTDNIGKEVWVYGSIEKYFSVAGMKSTSDYSFDGKTTSVNAIDMTTAPKVIFNVAGQKLNTVQKGINIVDGKKIYVK